MSRNVWGFKGGPHCLLATAVAVLFMILSEHIIFPDPNSVGVVKKPENRSRSAQGSEAEDDNAVKLTTTSDAEDFNFATAHDGDAESFSTGLTATRNKLPKPLNDTQDSSVILHVHVGKAGGTSFQDFYRKAKMFCRHLLKEEYGIRVPQNGNIYAIARKRFQNPSEDDDKEISCYQTCMFARLHHVHVMTAPPFLRNTRYSHYIVTIRNPIDRLVSWFSFEQKKMTLKQWQKRGGPASSNGKRLFHKCYGSIAEMARDSLVESGYSNKINELSLTTTTPGLPNIANPNADHLDCRALARACFRGEIMCPCHNYYNYEFYLEKILAWKGMAYNQTLATPQRDFRIDVIRIEYTQQDMDRTMQLWTGHSMHTDLQGMYEHKNARPSNTTSKVDSLYSSPDALQALCRLICSEMVIYKKILWLADNLFDSEVEESYRALDSTCGFTVDEVCGTNFHFRDVQSYKKGKRLPW